MKPKACRICNAIYDEGSKCPKCESKESTEGFKGRVFIKDSENSEIAKNLNIKSQGEFAIKTR